MEGVIVGHSVVDSKYRTSATSTGHQNQTASRMTAPATHTGNTDVEYSDTVDQLNCTIVLVVVVVTAIGTSL